MPHTGSTFHHDRRRARHVELCSREARGAARRQNVVRHGPQPGRRPRAGAQSDARDELPQARETYGYSSARVARTLSARNHAVEHKSTTLDVVRGPRGRRGVERRRRAVLELDHEPPPELPCRSARRRRIVGVREALIEDREN